MEWEHPVFLDYLAFAIGIAGVVVIVWGVIKGVIEFLGNQYEYFSRRKVGISLDAIRFDVSRFLLLGLEFLIAADVIRTIVQPSLDQIAVLAAIVIIRTVIGYFLNREIEHGQRYHK
jgi:uncharacterized membrane protein